MKTFDMSKIYGFQGIEATAGESIDLRAPQSSGRLGAKKGIIGTGGSGGEGK